MPRIILSAAPEDCEAARFLSDWFRESGWEVQPFADTFSPDVVDPSDALLLILSPVTAASDRVRAEVGWALQAGKPIFPLLLEKTSLLPFPFLVDAEATGMDFDRDPSAVLMHIASVLGASLPDPLVPPQIPARPNDAPAEDLVRLDDAHAAALFFAAIEFSEPEVEKTIFIYDTLLRCAPDYVADQLGLFIRKEIPNLQAVWLQKMGSCIQEAIKQGNLLHAAQILGEMQALNATASVTRNAEHQLLHAQVKLLDNKIKEAISKREWETIEALVQAVAVLDTPHSHVLRQEAFREHIHLLNKTADTAISAKRWEEAEKIIAELGGLDHQFGEQAQHKLNEAALGWRETLATAAINAKRWEEAEKIIAELGGLDHQRGEEARRKLDEAALGWRETLATTAIRGEQWETVDRLIDDIITANPEATPAFQTLRIQALRRVGLALIENHQLDKAEALALRLQTFDAGAETSILLRTHILQARVIPFVTKAGQALQNGEWIEAITAAEKALALQPKNEDATHIYRKGLDQITCDSLYQQAVLAAEAERFQAMALLMQRIQNTLPEYGDPLGIVKGQPLEAPFVPFIKQQARLEAHPSPIRALAMSSDGTFLVTGADDLVLVWDLPSLEPIQSLKIPGSIATFALSPDNEHLATVSTKGELRVWSLRSGKLILQEKPGLAKIVFSPDGRYLAAGTQSGDLIFWHTENSSPIQLRQWASSASPFNAIVISPDGRYLATAQMNNWIVVYHTEWLEEKPKRDNSLLPNGPDNQVSKVIQWHAHALAFLNGGEHLLAVPGTSLVEAENIRIWDMQGEVVGSIHGTNYTNPVIAVSPQESLLVTAGSTSRVIDFWDLKTGKRVKSLLIPGHSIGGMAFTPDGLHLVTGDAQGNVIFWGVGGADEPTLHKGKRGL